MIKKLYPYIIGLLAILIALIYSTLAAKKEVQRFENQVRNYIE